MYIYILLTPFGMFIKKILQVCQSCIQKKFKKHVSTQMDEYEHVYEEYEYLCKL